MKERDTLKIISVLIQRMHEALPALGQLTVLEGPLGGKQLCAGPRYDRLSIKLARRALCSAGANGLN